MVGLGLRGGDVMNVSGMVEGGGRGSEVTVELVLALDKYWDVIITFLNL